MNALVYKRYGPPDVLRLEEVEKPVPKHDEVLIKIHAASINARDWHLLTADIPLVRVMGKGLLRPRNPVLGADLAGRVEAIGADVERFRAGDPVFGFLSRYGGRTFAEYACAGEDEIAAMPANLSFEQAAAVPIAAITALQGLRDKGKVRPGQKVLIQGASGGVGTFAVQIGKSLGAEVTGVCSARNLGALRSLGADHAIDYERDDITRSEMRFDVILAVNGYHPIADYFRILSPEGILVVAGGSMIQLLQAGIHGRRASKAGSQKAAVVSLAPSQGDLAFVKDLLESGKVTPVIDWSYPLGMSIEAFRHFKAHAKGKVVITI